MALKAHPAVFDAVVVGVPDERWGERVAAVVQPRPGARRRRSRSSTRTAARSVGGYKVPRELHVVDEMQRSPSGKADYKWAKRGGGCEWKATDTRDARSADRSHDCTMTDRTRSTCTCSSSATAHIVTRDDEPARGEERHQYGDALPARGRVGHDRRRSRTCGARSSPAPAATSARAPTSTSWCARSMAGPAAGERVRGADPRRLHDHLRRAAAEPAAQEAADRRDRGVLRRRRDGDPAGRRTSASPARAACSA